MSRWTVTKTWIDVQADTAADAVAVDAGPASSVNAERLPDLRHDGCEATTVQAVTANPIHPERCGGTAIARVVLNFCGATMTCEPYNCQSHEVCERHLREAYDAGLVKDRLSF